MGTPFKRPREGVGRLIFRALSGCCPRAFLGKSDESKKKDPRGKYYGCLECGTLVDRRDAAYQLRLMRRTAKDFGLRLTRR